MSGLDGLGTKNYFTEMCSGSEAGSYLRLIDFVHHSTLGLRVIKKKKKPGTVHSVFPREVSRGGRLSGRGTARAEDAQGTPTQSHISPSILVYEEKRREQASQIQNPDLPKSGPDCTPWF